MVFIKKIFTKKTRKKNPFQLIYYKHNWSKTRTEKNNGKYWQWEIENNGLTLP